LTGLLDQAASLLKTLRCTGDAVTVHDLRVTVRRARLHARVGAQLLLTAEARNLHRWGRTLNRCLGPVRDCDVAMNWVAGQADPLLCLNALHEHRKSVWATTAQQLDWQFLGTCPRPVLLPGHPQKTLRRVLNRELDSTRSKVLRSTPRLGRLTPAQRHALRRKVRRWRYLREMALPSRKQRKDRLLKNLNRTQDALGELQNLRVTQSLLRKVLPAEERHTWNAALRTERIRHVAAGRRHLKALRRAAD